MDQALIDAQESDLAVLEFTERFLHDYLEAL